MNEANQPQFTDSSDEISLAELWLKVKSVVAYLWGYKFLIVAVGLLFGAGGYFKVKLAKPSYTASLTFALEQGGGGGVHAFDDPYGYASAIGGWGGSIGCVDLRLGT